jgi:hypothetical protein
MGLHLYGVGIWVILYVFNSFIACPRDQQS